MAREAASTLSMSAHALGSQAPEAATLLFHGHTGVVMPGRDTVLHSYVVGVCWHGQTLWNQVETLHSLLPQMASTGPERTLGAWPWTLYFPLTELELQH